MSSQNKYGDHLNHREAEVSLEHLPNDELPSVASIGEASECDLLLPLHASHAVDCSLHVVSGVERPYFESRPVCPYVVSGVERPYVESRPVCPYVVSGAECPDVVCSPARDETQSVSRYLGVTSPDSEGSGEEVTCRICQDGDRHEKLFSPCLCSGSVGFVHVSCLNTWLQVTSRTACELCGFPFPVTRKMAPVSEYLRHPRANMDLPNLICDLICLAVLTPLLLVSVYMSGTGTLTYESLGQTGSMCAVVTLLVALVLVYISWAVLASVYHVRVWQAWREQHSTVTTLKESQLVNLQPQAISMSTAARPKVRKLTRGRRVAVRQGRSGQSSQAKCQNTELLMAPISKLTSWIKVNNRVAARSPQHPA